MSSLRGITHVLTCKEPSATPFTFVIPPEGLGPPQLLSSTRIEKGKPDTLCGGLELEMSAKVQGEAGVAMALALKNRSDFTWEGTVTLVLGSISLPVSIGAVGPGEVAKEVVPFEPPRGASELAGTLLIGP
jgi:hypothetical protein